ncbi:MAG: NAD(P)-dependent glycerol-3-phosphate dehydrogenase [Gammaproteobacteria bacterium]|nr:NAD(P)-dependent glycerol-3-phosphate dehydrogenase [Gammaproteobacteria bacterium]
MRVAVVGAGNFGTVIANIVARNGCETYLVVRNQNQLEDMLRDRENKRYLPGYKLADDVRPTADLQLAAGESELLFITVPSTSFRQAAKALRPYVKPSAFVISGTKGVEATNFRLMSQIVADEIPQGIVGVLSGPNLAEEIAAGLFAGTVIASKDPKLVATVQEYLQSSRFRVYGNSDVYGVELGGALKNIYAIICGMATTLQVGQNALAMVMTRSLAEMNRFAKRMDANAITFLGLAGVGDLIATCSSEHSRNFQLGREIARGLTLDEAQTKLGKLAEGVNTLQVVFDKKEELGVYMPLVDGLYRVLFRNENMLSVIGELMTSVQQPDVESISAV